MSDILNKRLDISVKDVVTLAQFIARQEAAHIMNQSRLSDELIVEDSTVINSRVEDKVLELIENNARIK